MGCGYQRWSLRGGVGRRPAVRRWPEQLADVAASRGLIGLLLTAVGLLLRVAERLPKNLHLGTSSLSFPGWAGIVYAEQYRVCVLARHGLRAYAQHPLLNALNVDSTFYRPPSVELLTRQAAEVPENFRFVVKAYTGLTDAEIATMMTK